MPEKTVRRRLQDCDATLASDHGPIFSTVAKLVEALKRSFPRERKTRSAKKEALPLALELLRATKYEGLPSPAVEGLQPISLSSAAALRFCRG